MVNLHIFQSFSSIHYPINNISLDIKIIQIKLLLDQQYNLNVNNIKLLYRGKMLENEKYLYEYVSNNISKEEINKEFINELNNEFSKEDIKIQILIAVNSKNNTNETIDNTSSSGNDSKNDSITDGNSKKEEIKNDINIQSNEFKEKIVVSTTTNNNNSANIIKTPIFSTSTTSNDTLFPTNTPSLASTKSLTSATNRNNSSLESKQEINNDVDNKKERKPKISWIAALNAHYGQGKLHAAATNSSSTIQQQTVIPPVQQIRQPNIPVVPFPRPQNHVHEYRNEHLHDHHNHHENNHHINHQHLHNHLHNQHFHNQPNADLPPVQPIDNGRRYFQPMLLIKLALIVSVLTFDQSLNRTLLVLFVAIAYYLYEVFAPPANVAVVNNNEDIDENQDVIEQLRRDHEANQQQPREIQGGVLKNMERFVIGFFASLSPSWHPRR